MGGSGNRRRRARRVWLAVHTWLGLGAGGLIAAICLTGVAVSYWHEIERVLYSYPARSARLDRLPIDSLVSRATRACRGCGPVLELTVSPAADVVTAYYPTAKPGGVDEVVVDARNTTVLRADRADAQPVAVLYRLHSALFCGEVGRSLVGLLGVALLLSLLSGIVLWAPRRELWRRAISIRPYRRKLSALLYDLHKTSGATAMLVLATAGLTGVALGYPVNSAALLGASAAPPEVRLPAMDRRASPTPSLESLVVAAERRFPGAEFDDLMLPTDPGQALMIVLKQPGEITHYGRTRIWIDPNNGEILKIADALNATSAQKIYDALTAIHSGIALGEPVRLVFAIVAVAPLALFFTGSWFWLRNFQRMKQKKPGKAVNASSSMRDV